MNVEFSVRFWTALTSPRSHRFGCGSAQHPEARGRRSYLVPKRRLRRLRRRSPRRSRADSLRPRFMVPMRGRRILEALHELQRAAGILPAEDAWVCRRDAGSTFLGSTFTLPKFMAPRRDHGIVETLHEPQRAAGILPAEGAWICRRDVGRTLLGRAFACDGFMAQKHPQSEGDLPRRLSRSRGGWSSRHIWV